MENDIKNYYCIPIDKQRVKYGEKFYSFDEFFVICEKMEWNDDVSLTMFRNGNYFITKQEAELAVRKIKNLLKTL